MPAMPTFSESPFGQMFGNFEKSMEDSMERMHDHMARMEQEMQSSFKHGMEMSKNLPKDGEVQSQSFQSSSKKEVGPDGKLHEQSSQAGSQV